MEKAVKISAYQTNDQIAAENRKLFSKEGIYTINIIGSPGCGKTRLLENTHQKFRQKFGFLVGDVKTALDSNRLVQSGHQNSYGIETGGGCHLSAAMIRDSLKRINISDIDYLFIENVGNLVCPSTYDLGENIKVAVLSIPEGDEKVRKYPALFLNASVVIINKIDLLNIMDYNIKQVRKDCVAHNSQVRIFEISCKTGQGLDEWFHFLKGKKFKLIKN